MTIFFRQKSKNFLLIIQNEKKIFHFFPNDYSGHLQGSSDRVATKKLARNLNCFCRKSEKTQEKNFSFLSSNYSYEGMEFTFDNWQSADVFFLQIDQRLYAKNPKSKARQTISVPRNSCFVQKAPLATYNAVPTDLPQAFGRNLWKSPFKLQEKLKHVNFFPQNVPVEKWNAVLTTLPFFLCQKSEFLQLITEEKLYPKLFSPNDYSGHLQGSSHRVATK